MIKPDWSLPFEIMCDTSDYTEFYIVISDKKGVENLAIDHLSRLENPDLKKLNYANYLARRVLPFRSTHQEKQKFFNDMRHFTRDEPFLFKQCAGQIIDDVSLETRLPKFSDNVIEVHQEDIMGLPPWHEKSLKPSSTGLTSFAMHVN
ncbi:hypothetical protein Tco_1567386 [Tanacetum coccineum]